MFRIRWITAVLLLFTVVLSVGCAAYHMGNQDLFDRRVQTVSVSIVGNETWRRGYGERLTEAIVREIENRTPYKVVRECNADMILKVTIVDENKQVKFQNDWADPRELTVGIAIKAEYIDRRTNQVMQAQCIDSKEFSSIAADSSLIAEAGQSNATSSQTVMTTLAQRIVGMMEVRW